MLARIQSGQNSHFMQVGNIIFLENSLLLSSYAVPTYTQDHLSLCALSRRAHRAPRPTSASVKAALFQLLIRANPDIHQKEWRNKSWCTLSLEYYIGWKRQTTAGDAGYNDTHIYQWNLTDFPGRHQRSCIRFKEKFPSLKVTTVLFFLLVKKKLKSQLKKKRNPEYQLAHFCLTCLLEMVFMCLRTEVT